MAAHDHTITHHDDENKRRRFPLSHDQHITAPPSSKASPELELTKFQPRNPRRVIVTKRDGSKNLEGDTRGPLAG
jgi:hypothetical protein